MELSTFAQLLRKRIDAEEESHDPDGFLYGLTLALKMAQDAEKKGKPAIPVARVQIFLDDDLAPTYSGLFSPDHVNHGLSVVLNRMGDAWREGEEVIAIVDFPFRDGRVKDPADPGVQLENTDERIFNVHTATLCEGRACTIHNRTDHLMRGFPQHYREDKGLMERVCAHGVGHPDPDEGAYIEARFGYGALEAILIHGCCEGRCCVASAG